MVEPCDVVGPDVEVEARLDVATVVAIAVVAIAVVASVVVASVVVARVVVATVVVGTSVEVEETVDVAGGSVVVEGASVEDTVEEVVVAWHAER